ncbi:unnamed protein product [Staurois parvus]|uniref:Uncharacterized protein n=1 Tax=Staurois parvus TaxID=386267 RepID=A0ABN9CFX3_9NEOB|nr:unnamed protein product [Staurois parvus]
MPHISAYQCTSMPHISGHLSCLSMSPCHHQCQSVPPISAANQCHLSVPCPSVSPIGVHQCSLSVPITAASLAHISEGEKSLIYKIV